MTPRISSAQRRSRMLARSMLWSAPRKSGMFGSGQLNQYPKETGQIFWAEAGLLPKSASKPESSIAFLIPSLLNTWLSGASRLRGSAGGDRDAGRCSGAPLQDNSARAVFEPRRMRKPERFRRRRRADLPAFAQL